MLIFWLLYLRDRPLLTNIWIVEISGCIWYSSKLNYRVLHHKLICTWISKPNASKYRNSRVFVFFSTDVLQIKPISYQFVLNCFTRWLKICVRKSWNLKLFSHNCRGYFKNHWTKYRLVCTQMNAFFMLNPNMAMKIWISKIFEKVGKFWPVVCTRHPCGER